MSEMAIQQISLSWDDYDMNTPIFMGRVNQQMSMPICYCHYATKLVDICIYRWLCTLVQTTRNGINNNQQRRQAICIGAVDDHIWHCGGVVLTT